jgi:ATP-dependent helicase/nuclease subunit A
VTLHPQTIAADPKLSAFVAANAGSGKTKTLVERVARLLLHDARPEAILCVTYTKAAAAEMQRRLYQRLGDWAVMDDARLAGELIALNERPDDLPKARHLFARALETPGGLKIQTLHAFCEKLLRRFPLEAAVSPGFKVLEDVAAAEVSAGARDRLALYALDRPEGPIAEAYAHFAMELDLGAFEGLLKTFETERAAVQAYLDRCGGLEGAAADVWHVCGFNSVPTDPDAVEAEAAAACDWARWRDSAGHLIASGKPTDGALGHAMAAFAEAAEGVFADLWRLFSTDKGEPSKRLGTQGLPPSVLEHLREEQARLHDACKRAKAARIARDTVHVLVLAHAYASLYDGEKARRGALDFPDLIARTRRLLTERADAAWVLYKLDGGVDHVLLDEAQDTSPDQWAILEALTGEFFVGEGGRAAPFVRTLFAVGDEKQSIYSFQGADPDRLLIETRAYIDRTADGGFDFRVVPLIESWRSTPEVLTFVDEVFADAGTQAAVRPPVGEDVVRHVAVRPQGFGAVDLWPIFQDEPHEPPDAWDAPLDAAPPETARKRLARRIAEAVKAIACGQGVVDKGDPAAPAVRPATAGDVLILVRRRDALFEEIIRALKKAGLPVAGADRLKLSDHVVFQDVLSLFRFCLFPADDLTLAELLRSPFCDVDERGLYDLAYERDGSLWRALHERGDARAEWREARSFLTWARQESRKRAPFDLFGRVLSQLDPAGRSMRQRILTRLGREAEDALDEISAQILTAEGRGVHDLERLVAALERADIQVKRELESEHGGEVRVMTVHGAKGLEAPIVILPDTTGKPPPNRGAVLKTEAGGFLFAPRKGDDCEASAEARALLEEKTAHEQLRLMYVALTRARDRLIVAGRISARDKAAPVGSWYARVESAFARPAIAGTARDVDTAGQTIRRFGADPHPSPTLAFAVPKSTVEPSWLRTFADAEAVQRYASPSTYVEGRQGGAPSPLGEAPGLGRFRRGDLVHRLLQLLPDLPPDARADGARRLLLKERDLTDDQRAEMAAAALGVLNDPVFAEVFGPGSRAEAAVAGGAPGLPSRLAVSGRVDRMVVTPGRVLVVDFKSNRPSPDRIDEADDAYLIQMAIYVAVLRAIFPGRAVEAALVWTDGPKLMPIPENLIEQMLVRIRESD